MTSKFKHSFHFKKSFFIILGVFIFIILIVNILRKDPVFTNLNEQVLYEIKSGQPELAEKTYQKMISTDSLNVDLHYNYIENHFDIPQEKTIDRYETIIRDDKPIISYYKRISHSKDLALADIGNYGMGLVYVSFHEYDSALDCYLKVRNPNLKFLNNSIGYIYWKKGSNDLARRYFYKEIGNHGNRSGAYHNIIQILYEEHDINQLSALLKDKDASKEFSFYIKRAVYFYQLNIPRYISTLFGQVFHWVSLWGSIAAFLIMMIWVVYLRRLDIFEGEEWSSIAFTAILGMLFSFATFFFTDIIQLTMYFNLSGGVVNDFLYCVFGIGFVEELVKIIPLILILRYTKVINEPFDYILYASVSALGFAFIENLVYFNNSSLHIIHGRALTATVAHMFFSSVVAYGFISGGQKQKLRVLMFFFLAALAHGFYDFWLINDSMKDFSFITTIFFIICVTVWIRLINKALNDSSFFDEQKFIEASRLQDYLIYSLSSVLIFEYIALAFSYGQTVANNSLLTSVYTGTYLIVILSSSLSKLKLQRTIPVEVVKDNQHEFIKSFEN